MAKRTVRAARSPSLSEAGDNRYVIVDTETGEILDDAQEFGYKTAHKAYAAYGYQHRDKSQDGKKAQKKRQVRQFCKSHQAFVDDLEDVAFHIAKGSYGPEITFNAKAVKQLFKANGYTDLPFTAGEFLRYWR